MYEVSNNKRLLTVVCPIDLTIKDDPLTQDIKKFLQKTYGLTLDQITVNVREGRTYLYLKGEQNGLDN